MARKTMPYYNRELSWMDFNTRVLEEAFKKGKSIDGTAAFSGAIHRL